MIEIQENKNYLELLEYLDYDSCIKDSNIPKMYIIEKLKNSFYDDNTKYIKDTILINTMKEDYFILENFKKEFNILPSKILHTYFSVHRIIKNIEEIKSKNIKPKKFISKLEESKQLFERLNDFEKNRGNNKLSKRVELLLLQFDKYQNNKTLNSTLKRFFDLEVGSNVPSIDNVLTIFKQNIKNEFEYYNKQKLDNFEEKIDFLFEELFNITKFRADLKYDSIKFGLSNIRYFQTVKDKSIYKY